MNKVIVSCLLFLAFGIALKWSDAVSQTSYTTDGAPITQRHEKKFDHIVSDTVRYVQSTTTTTVTLRSAPKKERRSISFSDAASYVVVAMGADSVVRSSGTSFVIYHASVGSDRIQSFIAIGN